MTNEQLEKDSALATWILPWIAEKQAIEDAHQFAQYLHGMGVTPQIVEPQNGMIKFYWEWGEALHPPFVEVTCPGDGTYSYCVRLSNGLRDVGEEPINHELPQLIAAELLVRCKDWIE